MHLPDHMHWWLIFIEEHCAAGITYFCITKRFTKMYTTSEYFSTNKQKTKSLTKNKTKQKNMQISITITEQFSVNSLKTSLKSHASTNLCPWSYNHLTSNPHLKCFQTVNMNTHARPAFHPPKTVYILFSSQHKKNDVPGRKPVFLSLMLMSCFEARFFIDKSATP